MIFAQIQIDGKYWRDINWCKRRRSGEEDEKKFVACEI